MYDCERPQSYQKMVKKTQKNLFWTHDARHSKSMESKFLFIQDLLRTPSDQKPQPVNQM